VAFCASSFLVELSGVHFASALGVNMFVIVAGVLFGAATGWPLRSAAYRS
jgi:hypothetical protein